MRKIMSFVFGVLVGTIVATAWAHFPNYPTVDSPRDRAPAIAPSEMMTNGAQPLPVQGHIDAF